MIVINDDTRDSQVQNKKKDTQQDTKIASLQAAVDSINAQITAINSSISALSDTIDDKYSAQTQALMSALTSQINALSESLSALISTNQINADYGNFERLAVTVSATIESLAAVVLNVSDKATISEAEVTSLEAVNETVTSLTATEATLQRAVVDSLSIVSNFSLRALSAESANIFSLNSIQISASQKVTTPEIYTKVITGTTWQTPIGTPDNTELLKITVPHYEGIIQLITEDREFNVSIFNNSLFTWTEQSGYLFRIQRNDENTEIYLENIGDTVNYQLLFIGSKNIVTATSEIVDKTGIRQNVYTFNGVYGAGSGEGGSGSQIIFVDELPSAGEEGIIYLSKTLGAWVWNDDDGELVPLTGTDLPEAVQTNTENIGDLSDLTTTADSDLVSAINELDSDVGDLTSLTTTAKASLVAAINEVDSNTDSNTGAIATINGNDTGLSMRQVAQDVTSNVYIPCGSVAFANLPALSSARIGDVYNVEDSFTTTSDFIEGAGHVIPAGSNVVVVDNNGARKWDVFGMPIDTSGFMTKTDPIGTGKLSLNRKTGTAEGNFSTATGKDGTARGYASHAEGYNTTAYADFTHAEGHSTTAFGDYAHAEGYQSNAEKIGSHAEGNGTHALGDYSHVEGSGTETKENGYAAHAEGGGTSARGYYDHAEGLNTIASGGSAHAEGDTTQASGSAAHAEGAHTVANQQAAHAEGYFTIANSNIQHVQGKYNVEDSNGVYADIVGNGTAANDRKNIEATTWTGDKRLKGTVYVGCNDDSTGGTDLNTAKADKVTNATAGNLASLDASGNLTDSGINGLNVPLLKVTACVGDNITFTALSDNQGTKFYDGQLVEVLIDSNVTVPDNSWLTVVDAPIFTNLYNVQNTIGRITAPANNNVKVICVYRGSAYLDFLYVVNPLISAVVQNSTAPITSGGVFNLTTLNVIGCATEAEVRNAIASGRGSACVRIMANITLSNGVIIPAGTEGILCRYGLDAHFIGNYHDGSLYSWFINSNGLNAIKVLS